MSSFARLNDPKSLQLYIPGDGHIKDVSGHNLVTAWVGTAAYRATGYSGHTGMEFTGAATAVSVAGVALGAANSYSIAMNIIVDTVGATAGRIWECGSASVIKGFVRSDVGNAIEFDAATIRTPAGSWSNGSVLHVVMTWETGTGTGYIYLDGKYSAVGLSSLYSDTTTLYIGNNPLANRGFDGVISNVRLYNVILTGDEAHDLFLMEQGGGF